MGKEGAMFRIMKNRPIQRPLEKGSLGIFPQSFSSCLDDMHLQGIPPPHRLHADLQQCAATRDLKSGRRVHSLLIACAVSSATSLGDHLVRFFILCGSFFEANLAFATIKAPSVQTWQVIIEMHSKFQENKEVIDLFHLMKHEGLIPNRAIYVCVLKVYSSIKALRWGILIHEEIKNHGIVSDLRLSSALVDMYAKCGNLSEARKLFDGLQSQNVLSYNAIISAYGMYGYELLALQAFEKLQIDGFLPDEVSYMSVLKAFNHARAIVHGRKIHNQVIETGMETNIVIGSSLVDLYCKCGSTQDAHKVFEGLENKDMVLWCTMLAGYTENGDIQKAFELFSKMKEQKMKLDNVVFSTILKACSSVGGLAQARILHDLIIRELLDSDVVVGTALINIYAKHGIMEDAYMIFESLEKRNVLSWGAMIAGYVNLGENISALRLFETTQEDNIGQTKFIFSCALNACGGIGALREGMMIHKLIIEAGYESDLMIGNSLIDMYAKCGNLAEASRQFERLQNYEDASSWGIIIDGYAQQGNMKHALNLFGNMVEQCVIPDRASLLGAVKGCVDLGSVERAMLVHHIAIENDILKDVQIGNIMVDMYAKCGGLDEAQSMFSILSYRDVVSWCALITGYAEGGQGIIALELFEKMLKDGIESDRVILLAVLKVCCSSGCVVASVMVVHGHIMKSRFSSDIILGNSLVDIYAKLGMFEEACKVFSQILVRDSSSYSSLIAGYAMHGHGHTALELFGRMQHENLEPNKIAFSCTLYACGYFKDIERALLVHHKLIESGLEVDMDIGITLVQMYLKCGSLEEACHAFNHLPYQNQVSWSVMIAGYVDLDYGLLALLFFEKMRLQSMMPNVMALSSALKACASVGAVIQGQWLHDHIIRESLENDLVIGSGLVDMYGKCGSFVDASKLFDELKCKDAAAWGTVISAFSRMGNLPLVRECLQTMQEQGLRPDRSIYSCILSAFSLTGQVNEGSTQFMSMLEDKAIITTADHFISMAHLLGCSGQLLKARELIECMPTVPDVVSQTSLLASCISYGNMHMAGESFQQLVSQHPNLAVSYLLMSNAYAGFGRGNHFEEQ